MIKLHCDRCGREITNGQYYTININKQDINKAQHVVIDYTSANSVSSTLNNLFEQLSDQKMYCETCRYEIVELIERT